MPAKSASDNDSIVVIGHASDLAECRKIQTTLKVAKIYTIEFLLTGILRQKFDYEVNVLEL
jgi:S-ribosylhomocysteine lyase LuxS involved in autoinducer biosynthesis